jgi:UDP:flavonoid glycosyltransferase YjiC (YdhE family)
MTFHVKFILFLHIYFRFLVSIDSQYKYYYNLFDFVVKRIIMSQSRTILFAMLGCHGCINPSLAIAQVLVNQGHRVVFILEKPFEGKLTPYGIQEEILPPLKQINAQNQQDNQEEEYWPKYIAQHAETLKGTPIHQFEHLILPCFTTIAETGKAREEDNKKIIEKVQPDLFVLDTFYCSPAFTNSSIPWVRLPSANPLMALEDERFPPAFSGLPSGVKYKPEWEKFLARKREIYMPLWNSMNEWVTSLGAPAIPPNPLYHPDSPYANLYLTPKEIDLYDEENDHLRVKPKWHQFDSLVREVKEEFELPQSLSVLPLKGKLIYLSMGTIGSADVTLMKKLVDILANSPNRFIVSKGVQGDKYELASNMWGKNSLPQTKVMNKNC